MDGWQALSGGSAWGLRSPAQWETGLIQHDTLLIHALLLDLSTDTRDHGRNFFVRQDKVKPEKKIMQGQIIAAEHAGIWRLGTFDMAI